MTLSDFDRAREHLSWADEAIRELDAAFKEFGTSVGTLNFTDVDPNTGKSLYKVKLAGPIPSICTPKANEALMNTRHSFDQSLYAACSAINKTPKKDVHYPWSTSPKDLEHKLTGPKSHIAAEFWDTLRGQQPYGTSQTYAGGNDVLRTLAKVANQKHTVGVGLHGFVSGGMHPTVRTVGYGEVRIPVPEWDPVKNEMTLVIYSGDVHIENNYRFTFHIVLQESELPERLTADDGLRMFLDHAKDVLEKLEVRAEEVLAA